MIPTVPGLTQLPADLIDWIEALGGGTVSRVERQGRWRPHFFVRLETGRGAVDLLLRMERDGAIRHLSRFANHFDIEHEARTLAALQDSGLRVPGYHGYHPVHRCILMDRVAGSNDLSHLSPEALLSVSREYVDNLILLHQHRTSDVQMPWAGSDPSSEQAALAGMFAYAEADYLTHRSRIAPEPLIEFARTWLHANAPRGRPLSFVQGDTGPGQFMVDDGRLTALIDWELAHVGDPMVDIGALRMRNTLYPMGSINGLIDHYFERSPLPRDNAAIIYNTVLAMAMTPMALAASMANPMGAIAGMLPRLGWWVTLRRGLCDALCEAYGIAVRPPDLPSRDADEVATGLHGFLIDFLKLQCAPTADDEYQVYLMRGAIGIAETMLREQTLKPGFEDADLSDMALVLGHRPESVARGSAMLAELMATPMDEAAARRLLWVLTRMEYRREHLWSPLMVAQQSRPLERLPGTVISYDVEDDAVGRVSAQ